jgi:hypothetical protein
MLNVCGAKSGMPRAHRAGIRAPQRLLRSS